MPLNDPIGYAWLKRQYGLPDVPLPHQSYVSSAPSLRDEGGNRFRGWPQVAWPGNRPADHLEFALKHEGMNLPLLWHTFRRIELSELAATSNKRSGEFPDLDDREVETAERSYRVAFNGETPAE